MSDYLIIDIEEPEDSRVKGLIDDFNLLTINSSSDSQTKSNPIIHSLAGSTFQEAIQNDGPIHFKGETIPQPFEENNKGNHESLNDLDMAKLPQNDIQEGDHSEDNVEDLRNEKEKVNFYWDN